MTAHNTSITAGLEPEGVWKFFAQLSAIPRSSKKEEKVLDYLKNFADERKLNWRQDSVGNMVIIRPGSGGGEEAPMVVIQGHIDMVAEKYADSAHDFLTDGIKFVLNQGDEWLRADGTTLGADNGIGVAAALALLDCPPNTKLPPLECLFTVDEETGLTGAYGISSDLVEGKTFLNLDTEEWGEICIGCAGGGDSRMEVDVALEAASAGTRAMEVTVNGLLGGHSGLAIHEDRGNAVLLLLRTLRALLSELGPDARVGAMWGGDKRNAIAREASATVLVPADQVAAAEAIVEKKLKEFKAEFGSIEKSLNVNLTPAATALQHTIAPADANRLLSLLEILPHGVIKNSHALQGLVETSNNVAFIKATSSNATSATYTVGCLTRSSLGSAMESTRDRIATAASLCGARLDRGPAYPGWQPDPDSPLLQVTKQVYKQKFGREASIGAVHAGLECGILGERFTGTDMVSFGPTIRGAHSPDERVLISTVKPFWELTLGVLDNLADRR